MRALHASAQTRIDTRQGAAYGRHEQWRAGHGPYGHLQLLLVVGECAAMHAVLLRAGGAVRLPHEDHVCATEHPAQQLFTEHEEDFRVGLARVAGTCCGEEGPRGLQRAGAGRGGAWLSVSPGSCHPPRPATPRN